MTTIVPKSYSRREWQTVTLLGFIALLLVSYIYLTTRVIFHAVGKDIATREIAVLTAEKTVLETRVLALSSQITLDLAYARNFQDSGGESSYTIAWRDNGHE